MTTTTGSSDVPKSMLLPDSLKSDDLLEAPMIPLTIDENNTVTEGDSLTMKQLLSKTTPAKISLCFVVRRPGWGLCREEGRALTDLAAELSSSEKECHFFGVLKETGVDDKGLAEFYEEYFNFPLYKDADKTTYAALGGRKAGLTTYNPMKLYKGYKSMSKRLSKKKIDGNMKGEGLLQGGVILFDMAGKPVYAYQEETGEELPYQDILMAVESMLK